MPAVVVAATPALQVLIPIYNDWAAVSLLLVRLDDVLATAGLRASVLLVDDGSPSPVTPDIGSRQYRAVDGIDVLALRQNVGHQRDIAIALAYVHDHMAPAAVVVMDGDGEDAPSDVPRLLARLHELDGRAIVFAERQRRSEHLAFRASYQAYRSLHWLLTGIAVKVGNFSVIPGPLLARLVVVPELWNHYAAAVFKTRLPRGSIAAERAPRLSGQSSMNFVSLVGHGLSALSVHAEVIGVRLLVAVGVLVAVICALLTTVLVVRVATPLAVPGWAAMIAGLLVVLLFQAIALALFFALIIMHGRAQPLFIPIRDYHVFVGPGVRVFPQEPAAVAAAAPAATGGSR